MRQELILYMGVSSRSMIRVVSSCSGAYEDDWEKLPDSTLKSAVTISEDGKLVITPVEGIDKLFLKVVIPQDPAK